MSSSPSPVTSLGTDQELQEKLAGAKGKLVVLEFVKNRSQICEYVKEERDEIAKEMKDKAEFYELDVDKFKKYAEKFKVEALPAFVVMKNFVKKRHVVGTDDLRETIDDAYTKFKSNNEQVVSDNNGPEQTQDEANDIADQSARNGGAPSSEGPGGGRGTGGQSNNCSIL